MNFSTYLVLADSAAWGTVIDSSIVIEAFFDQCCAGGYVALPIDGLSSRIAAGDAVRVADNTGHEIGYIFASHGVAYEYLAASPIAVACLLREVGQNDIFYPNMDVVTEYFFKRNYFVCRLDFLPKYVDSYLSGSGVWGGFVHSDGNSIAFSPTTSGNEILAVPDVHVPTDPHKHAAFLASKASNALDRYLHLYHLFEIGYDYDLVQKIVAMPGNLNGVGKIFREIASREELDRLAFLIKDKCSGTIGYYEELLRAVFSDSRFHDDLEDMLFENGKAGNPFANEREKFMAAARAGLTTPHSGYSFSLDTARKFTAYIIYRFRCSIAHLRIGEFLLGPLDDEFVAVCAEPLIRSLLSNYLRR